MSTNYNKNLDVTEFDAKEFEATFGRPPETAFLALARNAMANSPEVRSGAKEILVLPSEGALEKDGCDFVFATYYFLHALDCPADARDFVLAVCALSGGNSEDYIKMTDKQIGELMGQSVDSVRRKRKALLAWEQANDWSIISIKQNELDRTTMKFGVTEYRVVVLPFVAEYIRRARARFSSHDNPQFELKKAVGEGFRHLANEVAADLPNAPLVARSKNFNSKKQEKTSFYKSFEEMIAEREERLLILLAECRDLEYTRGGEPINFFERVLPKMQATVSATPLRYIR